MSSSSSSSTSEDTRSRSVVVVGGGLAGLSCAHWLLQCGVANVTLLEARERLGGRMLTVERNGRPLEMGAQWIHGGCAANTVFNLAQRCGEQTILLLTDVVATGCS
jgi:monoamine oxidase